MQFFFAKVCSLILIFRTHVAHNFVFFKNVLYLVKKLNMFVFKLMQVCVIVIRGTLVDVVDVIKHIPDTLMIVSGLLHLCNEQHPLGDDTC